MVKSWLDRYQEAWRTDKPERIRDLFTKDALYFTGPYDQPWRGVDQIVEEWIALGESRKEWIFRYGIVAVTEEVSVVQGWTTYRGGEQPDRQYSNIWLIWLTPDGRAREFREWWVERPPDAKWEALSD